MENLKIQTPAQIKTDVSQRKKKGVYRPTDRYGENENAIKLAITVRQCLLTTKNAVSIVDANCQTSARFLESEDDCYLFASLSFRNWEGT